MAAERTWLAWWRTGLAATAGALAVGRLAPNLLHVASWPYVLLGCGYGAVRRGPARRSGPPRQHELDRALRTGGYAGCGSAPSGSSPPPASRWSC